MPYCLGMALSVEDAQLVERVRAGEMEAFRELYVRTHRPLAGFAAAISKSEAEAEEIVHDVFAAIWAQRQRWTPMGSVMAYLFAAVRNRASKARDHQRVVTDAARDADEVIDRASARPPETPQALAEADELRRAVARAVAALPERRRLALALRFGQGMSYAEIAQVLGVSEHAATQLVHRARDAVMPLLRVFREG